MVDRTVPPEVAVKSFKLDKHRLDGTSWFQTSASTRKGRNVARDPRCSVAVSVRDYRAIADPAAPPALVIGFGNVSDRAIAPAIAAIADLLRA
jgi:pyridoxamine 5'-phosphate oxidase-like protein